MAGTGRPQSGEAGRRSEREARFEQVWQTAAGAVAAVFERARHEDGEGMVQWVREKGYRGFGKALSEEAKSGADGRAYNWVGWLVQIAINLLRDEKRREKRLREKVGWRAPLERPREEAGGQIQGGSAWMERPDERWGSVEDRALWAVMVADLRRAVLKLGLLERLIVARWGTSPNDAAVARELKITAEVTRQRRLKALTALKRELEAMGYTAENRPRQPEGNVWGFTDEVERQRRTARAAREAREGMSDGKEARAA